MQVKRQDKIRKSYKFVRPIKSLTQAQQIGRAKIFPTNLCEMGPRPQFLETS